MMSRLSQVALLFWIMKIAVTNKASLKMGMVYG